MPRRWGRAAPKERGRVERALCERGYNADATLLVSSMNWGMESCSGLRLILLMRQRRHIKYLKALIYLSSFQETCKFQKYILSLHPRKEQKR